MPDSNLDQVAEEHSSVTTILSDPPPPHPMPLPFPFLSLPSEIRHRIYHFTLTHQHIRIYYPETEYNPTTTQWTPKGRPRHLILPFPHPHPNAPTLPPSPGAHLAQIHLTSRQLHAETITLYYTDNLFSFTHDWMGPPWLTSLRPWQQARITALAFNALPNHHPVPVGWCSGERLEPFFTGLRKLYVRRGELPCGRGAKRREMLALKGLLLGFWTGRGVQVLELESGERIADVGITDMDVLLS